MPASWDRLTWMVAMPSSAALAATVPVTLNSGRPRSSVTISASCQDSPAGAPSAFAGASLAATRAAWDATGRSASAAVNNRSTIRGVRRTDSANRSTSQTSIPMPMIITQLAAGAGGRYAPAQSLFDGDGLGQVARLVNVVALPGGKLAGEHLQRHGGDQRLQQGGHLGQPDQHVGVRGDPVVVLLGQHHGLGAAGADLLEVGQHLVVQHVPAPRRDDHEDRQLVGDQSDGAVLELAGGEPLGVDVGQLLELERAL